MNQKMWGWLALAGALALAPWVFYPFLLMKLMCFALFASAFNLLMGYAGLLSFGHAAFLGAGAYVAAWLLKQAGWAPQWALIASMAGAGLLGLIFGALAIRRSGIYFAMITLALSQMLFFVFLQSPFTGGEDGLQDVPRGMLFGVIDLTNDLSLYYFVWAAFLASLAFIYRVIHSPFGHALQAVREHESRAISIGYDAARIKLIAFVISATLTGLAGALKVLVMRFATLTDAHWHASGEVVLMTLLGGLGTVAGPLVGSSIIVTLQNELADKVGSWVTVIMGALFVVCVLLFRRGIVGELQQLRHRLGMN